MSFLPISLNLRGKKILMVGGGQVARHKLKTLSLYTSRITVLAPHIMREIADSGVKCVRLEYDSRFLKGISIVYACTDDHALNCRIKKEANARAILVNVADGRGLCDFISPAVYKDGSMSVAVGSQGRDVKLSVAWRDRLARLIRMGLLDERPDDAAVHLVGFGPGDPELLTFKAFQILSSADYILYDGLIDSDRLKDYPGEKIHVGKRKGKHHIEQGSINKLLHQLALRKKKVVRLKGGDPFIFGRGGEELRYLKERGIAVAVVPGITAALSAAAQCQIPLTLRGVSSSVAFCAGHPTAKIIVPSADTLVYYMAASSLRIIVGKVLRSGRSPSTPIVLVSNASLPSQHIKISTLEKMMRRHKTYASPLIAIIGRTAACGPSRI